MIVRKVGVIGLGIIGKPIAERLVKAGFEVAVYDIRAAPVAQLEAAGATACASSREVAAASELIISLVADEPQTDDVVSGAAGIIHALRPGTVFATGSTLGPVPVQRVAALLATRNVPTIDMPITGGFLAAADGALTLMLGGDAAAIARAMPAFQSFASTLINTGAVGSAQAAKLAHQLVMSINIMGLLEGLALGASGGVDPAVMREVLRNGLANSTVLKVWDEMGPRWKGMLKPADPAAPLPNMRKDLHSALTLARELDLPLPLGTLASNVADGGGAIGHDDPRF